MIAAEAARSPIRRACVLTLVAALVISSHLTLLASQSAQAAAADLPKGGLVGSLDPGSLLVGCASANVRVTITETSHLDPSCVYTKGFDLTASNVTLDCQGAVIQSPLTAGRGIFVTAPSTVALSNVTVRNCIVGGFLNSIRVNRQGFKSLAPGSEYDNSFSNILIENDLLHDSGGSGLFVDGFVTDVTMRDLEITGAGSVGIYLEAGSKENVVETSYIHANGFADASPVGNTFVFSGLTFRWWGTGREGIAVDGSRNNLIVSNTITGNSAGGVFLYKNCGEKFTQNPSEWFQRRYGSDGNVIEGNSISDAFNGVWVGSRAAENQTFMDCSDPAYVSDALTKIYLDPAAGNTVRDNAFDNVRYGIRVEDNTATIEGNSFTASDPAYEAVIVGTKYRTSVLGLPVAQTTINNNDANISENANPYRWIWDESGTSYGGDNKSLGSPVTWCEGSQPPIDPFYPAYEVVLDDPVNTPTASPRPVLPPLSPCPPPGLSGTFTNGQFGAISIFDAQTGARVASSCCMATDAWQIDVPPSDCGSGGGYKVFYTPPNNNFQPKWFNLKDSFSESDCVSAPSSALDMTIPASGAISGYVKDASTAADIDGAIVYAYDSASGAFKGWARTGTAAPGRYNLPLEPGAGYKVQVHIGGNYPDMWHDGAQSFTPATATVAPAMANFSVAPSSQISGYVKDASTSTDLPWVAVYAYDATTGSFLTHGTTGPDGRYALFIPGGSYKLMTPSDPSHEDLWSDGSWNWGESTPVTSPATVNFSPRSAGLIAGTASTLGTPTADYYVTAYTSDGSRNAASAVSDPSGGYALKVASSAASGWQYKVRFVPPSGLQSSARWYQDVANGDWPSAADVSSPASGISQDTPA